MLLEKTEKRDVYSGSLVAGLLRVPFVVHLSAPLTFFGGEKMCWCVSPFECVFVQEGNKYEQRFVVEKKEIFDPFFEFVYFKMDFKLSLEVNWKRYKIRMSPCPLQLFLRTYCWGIQKECSPQPPISWLTIEPEKYERESWNENRSLDFVYECISNGVENWTKHCLAIQSCHHYATKRKPKEQYERKSK